jgi:MEDS: MEthanogen/methylotroph, DcmR Sensory domain/Histidine kinase-like ATPase domain
MIDPGAIGAGDHVVQFYESEADLVARAGEYLADGVRDGAVVIVIADQGHRRAFAAHLRAAGVDLGEGTLVELDAAATLAQFSDGRRVDRDGFFSVVGTAMRAAAAGGRPVRAYGEMVALLWEAGDVPAALELETLWNELADEVPFSLYCAYPSGDDPAGAREHVCQAHSAVVRPPVETTWEFAPNRTAPRDARRVVGDALRLMGHGGRLVDDARVVITELAANAVVHAGSPFSVAISGKGSTVRILVHDASAAVPAIPEHSSTRASGRGLRIVAALASRWGVDVAADGKAVWAELAA